MFLFGMAVNENPLNAIFVEIAPNVPHDILERSAAEFRSRLPIEGSLVVAGQNFGPSHTVIDLIRGDKVGTWKAHLKVKEGSAGGARLQRFVEQGIPLHGYEIGERIVEGGALKTYRITTVNVHEIDN